MVAEIKLSISRNRPVRFFAQAARYISIWSIILPSSYTSV
jgi:hypothetical protein